MVKIDFSKKKTLLLVIFFLLLLITGVTVYYTFFRQKVEEDSIVDGSDDFKVGDIITESVDMPSEDKPKEYYVPPDLPKIITIPSLSVRAYLQSVGVDQYGLIAVPNNVHLAGWYINSVKPGKEGLSIITGHRDGATIGGIFRNLEKLKKASKISIEYGDGSMEDFEVVDLKTLSIEDAYDFMYSRVEGVNAQLNLVTCGGKWNKETKTYEKRIIVRAKGV